MQYRNVFEQHSGKFSDKWTSYLDIYSNLLDGRRDQIKSILEIGVQNGGSLEIWSEYLPEAKQIVGCDIEQKCGQLIFQDSRISVIVGDVNSQTIVDDISKNFINFDLIVDDGSHISSDVVRSFWQYFPLLTPGGIYVIEDLHASYWKDFEGGLGHPSSSMHFFKLVADLLNYEHWGIEVDAHELFNDFVYIDYTSSSSILSSIYSIQFFNSVCVIQKTSSPKQSLGRRVGAGSEAFVLEDVTKHINMLPLKPSQADNPFAQLSYLRRVEQAEILSSYMETNIILVKELETKSLELETKSLEIKADRTRIQELENSLTEACEQLETIFGSKSWKMILWYRKILRK